ncbi:hypothetical protein [Lewinella sp. 4G2]|uniref:glycosyl-4,4'-diaponeurosporenoate acyltransferase CrtO family protein n=1 Tax=Lewinella sp. 4G2 TaxID=1803372 RepID=UPI0007B46D9D|nr:hypothetical protein [Lewinella sp. 4G2]
MKKAALLLASLFLGYQSFALVHSLSDLTWNSWWLTLLMPVLLNLFVTGTFAFAGFALPTHRLLPEAYYHVRSPKQLLRWCQRLGVEQFRQFLLATFWRDRKQQAKYFDGTIAGVGHLDQESRKSEFGHLLPLLIISGVVVYLFVLGAVVPALVTLVINVIFNFYPILLQRHHRMRIQRMMDIHQRRAQRKP